MKQVAVVATEKEYAVFLMNNITKYLGRYAHFRTYSVAEMERMEQVTEDFLLLSAFNIFQKVRQKISDRSEIIVLSVALNKKQMEKLRDIPKGTQALLVNYDYKTCMHTITSMYASGFRDVELFPYFGEGSYNPAIELAITPNEADRVPPGIRRVIDVGESSVNMNSLYTIAEKLGVYEEFIAHEAAEARKEYYYISSSMERLLNDRENMSRKISTLIRLMDDGIIITDDAGRVYLCNEKAKHLMRGRTSVLIGFNILELFPELPLRNQQERLIRSADINLAVSVVEIQMEDRLAGYIVSLKDFEETERKQHTIRSRLYGVEHNAKYTFQDIIGDSPAIRDCIENARRIARSDASVTILGESGTGKEMFAQSIHNASPRSSRNFIAVNCAAIPENLLESEMFGYEEGAFTGAKKGGKIGYFELAHRGTIFLDEIGEMPLSLQAKLLRILEEKKVVRVGASRAIDVDVRVIAATNQDLYAMVEEGNFRQDLYYRLHVLPLEIPPLRARREDILPIFYALAHKENPRLTLLPETAEILKNYSWKGNVRELRNVVEFVLTREKDRIDPTCLPPLAMHPAPEAAKAEVVQETLPESSDEERRQFRSFLLQEGNNLGLYQIMLQKLHESSQKNERYGRQRLLEKIREDSGLYTEGEVRRALSRLSQQGFVRSSRGRGGSVITEKGRRLLQEIEMWRDR